MAGSSFDLYVEVDNRAKFIELSDEAIERALEAIGLQCETYAKNRCPADTGLLRNSITHAVAGKTAAIDHYTADERKAGKKAASGTYSGTVGKAGEKAVYVGSNVEYAAYVELGTSRRPEAQPYLKTAVMEHAEEYKSLVEEEMKQ